MNCREFIEFLDAYYADELPDGERDVFDEHIALCPDCQTYLETYRKTVRACREAFGANEPIPANVPDELINAILAARMK
jgi:anti-sigma factor RsiW